MRCAAHNNETLLRCGKCEAPICPDCTRMGPAGARCPNCAAIGKTPLFQVTADRLALGAIAGLLSGFVVGYLLRLASGLGFFLLWGALIGGGAVGEAVLRAVNRKRGPKVEMLAGVSSGVGVLAAFVTSSAMRGGPIDIVAILRDLQYRPFTLLSAGIVIFAAVSRVRFF